MPTKSPIKKLTGKVYFLYGNLHLLNDATALTPIDAGMSTISRAIIDGNKFNFDFESNTDMYGGVAKCFTYSDDKVLGKAHYQEGHANENIEGEIFYNAAGCIIRGKWYADDMPIFFIAELKYVSSFPDEKSVKGKIKKTATTKKTSASAI